MHHMMILCTHGAGLVLQCLLIGLSFDVRAATRSGSSGDASNVFRLFRATVFFLDLAGGHA